MLYNFKLIIHLLIESIVSIRQRTYCNIFVYTQTFVENNLVNLRITKHSIQLQYLINLINQYLILTYIQVLCFQLVYLDSFSTICFNIYTSYSNDSMRSYCFTHILSKSIYNFVKSKPSLPSGVIFFNSYYIYSYVLSFYSLHYLMSLLYSESSMKSRHLHSHWL